MARRKNYKKFLAPKTTDEFAELMADTYNNDAKQYHFYNDKKYDYTKRNEGDIWEEDGKKWTIEDGVKISVRRFNRNKLGLMPNFCPKCKKMMKDRDKSYWTNFKCCLDCSATEITNMKLNGTWEKHNQIREKENFKSMLKDKKDRFIDIKNNIGSCNTVMNSSGEIEKWKMPETDKIKYIEGYTKQIENIDTILNEIDNYDSIENYFKIKINEAKDKEENNE